MVTQQEGTMTSNMRIRATAGVVLRNADGQVLLMRRRFEDTWGVPGGGVEPGESWADAALRECYEETGWRARIDGLLGVYSDPATQTHTYPDGSLRHFVGVVFLASAVERDGSPDGEASELRWATGEDLPAPLFAPDIPVLHDAFAPDLRRPVIN
jgi:ADP-ribose pyrophosphatase YjhB (NUDIX family)